MEFGDPVEERKRNFVSSILIREYGAVNGGKWRQK